MKLNDLDLNKLEVFRVTAQSGSMHHAASLLSRTPSAISQSISGLEKSLNLNLFHRIGTKLFLSPQGQELLNGIHLYQENLEQLLARVTRSQSEVKGQLRIGLYLGLQAAQLGPALFELLQRHPALQVKQNFGTHRQLAALLVANRLDLAFSLSPLSALNRNLSAQKIAEENLILVATKNFRWPRSKVEFLKLPAIEYYESAPLYSAWLKHHLNLKQNPAPKVRAYAATLDHVLDLVERGCGVAVVSAQAMARLTTKNFSPHAGWNPKALSSTLWLNRVKGPLQSRAAVLFEQTLLANA